MRRLSPKGGWKISQPGFLHRFLPVRLEPSEHQAQVRGSNRILRVRTQGVDERLWNGYEECRKTLTLTLKAARKGMRVGFREST
jgi:hypothetical protein